MPGGRACISSTTAGARSKVCASGCVVYGDGEALVSGAGRLALEDRVASGGVTEFTVPRITTYAVIDLRASR